MSTRAITRRMSQKIEMLEKEVSVAKRLLVHNALAAIIVLPDSEKAADEIMKLCPDGECPACARIVCPHASPLHFHHDGCPACAEAEGS